MAQEKITYYRNEKEIAYIHSNAYPCGAYGAGIVLQGSVCIICQGGRRIYSAGECFYIGQDIPHAIEPVEDKTYSIVNLCIPVSVTLNEKERKETDAMRLKRLIADTCLRLDTTPVSDFLC